MCWTASVASSGSEIPTHLNNNTVTQNMSHTFKLQEDVSIHVVTHNLSHISSSSSSSSTCPTTSSPALIFLHYWGGSSRTWTQVIALLEEDGYPLIAIDFRGWGDSSGPARADAYSIAALASDVETVIQKLDLTAFVLVGLSMGAKVGQLIAGRGHSGLRGLVLTSPAPPTPLVLDAAMQEQQTHAYDDRQSACFVTERILTALSPPPIIVSALVDDQLRGDAWAKAAWPSYAMAEDISGIVELTNVPCTILAAERDLVEPLERVTREVRDRIPGAKLTAIPGSGHLSPIDAPEHVAREIRLFLSHLITNGEKGVGS